MDITFEHPKLRKVAEDEKALVRKFGLSTARKLQLRLTDLRSATAVADLRELPGRWHPLAADLNECWAADVGHPCRIVVKPTPPVPRLPDGGVDWQEVTRVTVIGLWDYH